MTEERVDKPMNCLGYLEYHGKLVEEGLLDARKSARALVGFDIAIRHFIGIQYQPLKGVEYEIPVEIRKGSWFVLIPESIGELLMLLFAVGGSTYALTAAKEMAKNDFKDIGLKSLFKSAIKAIQWTIRIGKHLGALGQRKFHHLRWKDGNDFIGIPNDKLEYLYVPRVYFEIYIKTPPHILHEMASVIEPERLLRVGVQSDNKYEVEEISAMEKSIFYGVENDSELLFPELTHGLNVNLDGVVTRGNGNSNSIGFRYQDSILTGVTREGSIVRFKKEMFSKCRIECTISRVDDYGEISLRKPKLIFDNLIQIEEDSDSITLFDE